MIRPAAGRIRPPGDRMADTQIEAPETFLRVNRPAVSWRSVLLGTLSVASICALTPFNDLVLSDSSLTAGFLPIGAVLVEFLLIVLLNAPLRRIAPRHVLSGGELSVVLLMTFVGCALPSWGLMRFLVPTPVAPFYLGGYEGQFWNTFSSLGLPTWLFPVDDIASGRASSVVSWFYTSIPDGETIPWAAWVKPALAWGVFVAAMLATIIAMSRLVMHQWVANERLPFPLVQVHAALIEEPARGHTLNAMLRSRLLWIGLGAVFAVQILSCLNAYFPRTFPRLPLSYDFAGIWGAEPISGQPFSFLDSKVKKASLSFILLGVTYFIRARTAFSLWGTFILINLIGVQQGMVGTQTVSAAWADQNLGASLAFVLGIAWIGRHQWKQILRGALGMTGGDGSQRWSVWVATGGTLVMVGWLCVVGVQWWMAAMIVGFILLTHLVVARVLAETGLPSFRSSISIAQVYTNFPIAAVSGRDVFFAGTHSILGPLTTRDSLAGFATTGLGLARQQGIDDSRRGTRLGGVITWALIVGCAVAGWSTLWCHYTYPTPTVRDITPQGNNFGAVYVPKRDMGDPLSAYGERRFPAKQHNPYAHFGIGFVVTTFLEFAALRWTAWPLLPVGYVASHGSFIGAAWFSIFVGWLAKVLIVRFGGASLFNAMRPLFVGVIFGEALAAGVWLIVNAIVVLGGGLSQSVKFMF